MDNPALSFGSGSRLLGSSAANILGMPPGLQQQSPSSPGFQPGLMPPPQQSAPPQMQQIQGAPQLPTSPMGMGQPQQPQQGVVGIPPGNPEALAIINAMKSRLQSLSKVDEMKQGVA